MLKSITSAVSAVSGCVANGHRTVYRVSASPLRSRTVRSSESGSDLGCPRTAFPLRRKLKCWSIYTPAPHRFACPPRSIARLRINRSVRHCVRVGSAQNPPRPRAPLHRARRYPPGQGVSNPIGGHYPAFIAPTGSCASPTSSPRLGITLANRVFAGCYQPLLQLGPSRRYLCESFPACMDPYPAPDFEPKRW